LGLAGFYHETLTNKGAKKGRLAAFPELAMQKKMLDLLYHL
jgi:hypothetical protein